MAWLKPIYTAQANFLGTAFLVLVLEDRDQLFERDCIVIPKIN